MSKLAFRGFVLALVAGTLPFVAGCDEDDDPNLPPAPEVTLRFVHMSGAAALAEDQLVYSNAAGNPYSVTLFEYLITDVTLVGAPGKHEEVFGSPVYVDAFEETTHEVDLGSVEAEEYTGLQFRWGVEAANNVSGNLDSAFDGMLWPAMNGGGYHCMRFEGDYTTEGSQTPGDGSFALHMGRLDRFGSVTDGAVLITLDGLDLTTAAGREYVVEIVVDVDAIMDDPVYDLDAEGDVDNGNGGFFPLAFPTMPSHMAQGLMRDNMGNVFSIGSVAEVE